MCSRSIRVAAIEVFEFRRPREDAYLGSTNSDDFLLNDFLFVRSFNGTVYPLQDRSVVIRVIDESGEEGWGETYGLVAPGIIANLIEELVGPYLKANSIEKPEEAWGRLYDLQRVRGYWGGYLADALAAIDIALWDLYSRKVKQSLQASLGRPGPGRLPAYVSGLPAPTTQERIAIAKTWQERGFDSLKIPVSATKNGDVVGEYRALREALGVSHKIAIDFHWTLTVCETVELERELRQFSPWFLEAPTRPEDIDAHREIKSSISSPLALGEEWRTVWDYKYRRGVCDIIQPEMGHTGVTQFVQLSRLAQADSVQIIPHATIGLGIFMAASLRASLAVEAQAHEFQHTIYHRNGSLLDGLTQCEKGHFEIEDSLGHGVAPKEEAFEFLTRIGGA